MGLFLQPMGNSYAESAMQNHPSELSIRIPCAELWRICKRGRGYAHNGPCRIVRSDWGVMSHEILYLVVAGMLGRHSASAGPLRTGVPVAALIVVAMLLTVPQGTTALAPATPAPAAAPPCPETRTPAGAASPPSATATASCASGGPSATQP